MEEGKKDEISYSHEDHKNVTANFTCPAPG
jgi:hypothetical protein